MPAWVQDHDIWAKAKAAAREGKKKPADVWALTTSIYQKMGGKIKGKSEKSLSPSLFSSLWKQAGFTGLSGAPAGSSGKRQFDEAKVKRDKGRFAAQAGAKGEEAKPSHGGLHQQLLESGVPHTIHPDGRIEVKPRKSLGQANAQRQAQGQAQAPPAPQKNPGPEFVTPKPQIQQPTKPASPTPPPPAPTAQWTQQAQRPPAGYQPSGRVRTAAEAKIPAPKAGQQQNFAQAAWQGAQRAMVAHWAQSAGMT